MIEGLIPVLCLVVIVVGSWVSVGFVLATTWQTTLVGRLLAVSYAITATWWSAILLGTILGPPVPVWLQVAQAVLFALIAVAVLWTVYVQAEARWCPRRTKGKRRL